MANITQQNRIKYQIDDLPDLTDTGLTMLQHFDYPESWGFNGGASLADGAKFGKRCAHFPDSESTITCSNTTGMFNLSPVGNYEAECFVKSEALPEGYSYYGGHTFKVFSEAKTWADAKAACEALGGHLAESSNDEANTFLASMLDGSVAWLGGLKSTHTVEPEEEGGDPVEVTILEWATGTEWSYTNWSEGEQSGDYLLLGTDGTWSEGSGTAAYICEWDEEEAYSILTFGDGLKLLLRYDGTLKVVSDAWDVDMSSEGVMTAGEWHHVLLRIMGSTAYVFIDGSLTVGAPIVIHPNIPDITPEVVTLGGYVGYMDEFAFRRNAGTGLPTVPDNPYGTKTVTRLIDLHGPVRTVRWSCANLPEGLTLSASGRLTGTPEVEGEYDCVFTVTTNWGTDTKTIRIVVQ